MQCERTGCPNEVPEHGYVFVHIRVFCSNGCYVLAHNAFHDPTKLLKGEGYVTSIGIRS